MVRVYLKGGVWKNSEDEILKAAVQKYGKQQWARVASLLNRKTAKQAKARWNEWLDPAIRKTEWSRAEEEKLLHLAKLMPAQWKTIAPLVGRTATQCQEHYEALLDQAAASAAGSTDATTTTTTTTASLRQQAQLRPGQIDAHPETKPAKPDPVDMDEDELEMLQEARARLANTVGKKAKRKQREKMLQAAKRLADLQKRRELKQAGLLSSQAILQKRKRRNKEIDLGVEIPFYKPAPVGFHDTSSEVARSSAVLQKHLQLVDLKQVNESMYRTRDREAAQAKKRQEARMRVLEQVNETYATAAAAVAADKKDEPAARRPRGVLQLPAPTVSDTELAQMAKLQQQQQQQSSAGVVVSADGTVTKALLGDYSDRPLPTPMRTPAAAAGGGDSLMRQASHLRQLEQGQTPLLVAHGGGQLDDNNDDDDDDDDRKQVAVAATPAFPDRAGVGRTPLSLSRRDALGLNVMDHFDNDGAASVGASTFATRQSSIRELARNERRAAKKARLELEAALAALPSPQFEYELAAPSMPADDENEDDSHTPVTVPDQADVEAAEREALRREVEQLYEARSSVLKRQDLPRPSKGAAIAIADFGADDSAAAAFGLIQQEIITLLQHDARAHPVPSKDEIMENSSSMSKKKKKRKQAELLVEEEELPPAVSLDVLPEQSLEQAKTLIQQELDGMLQDKIAAVVRDEKARSHEEAQEFLFRETMQARLGTSGDELSRRLVYQQQGGWSEATSDADRMASLNLEFDTLQEAIETLSAKNDKAEQKLSVVNGGYVKRAATIKQDILQSFAQGQNAQIEESVYSMLHAQEKHGGQNRIEKLQEDIASLRKAEAELQKRYGELLVEKRRAAVAAAKKTT